MDILTNLGNLKHNTKASKFLQFIRDLPYKL